jgi:hypothetical protein
MLGFAALIQSQIAPAIYADAAGSKAALQIYTDACTKGQIAISPSKAHTLSERDAVRFEGLLPFSRSTKKTAVIEFTYPRATYLIFAEFKHNQRRSIGRVCMVLSKVLSLDDALRAIMLTAPDIEPVQTWIPDTWKNGWVIDAPKRGFRASASFQNDRSILLQLGIYAAALDQSSSMARKQ